MKIDVIKDGGYYFIYKNDNIVSICSDFSDVPDELSRLESGE